MSSNESQPTETSEGIRRKQEFAEIANALRGLRFGTVSVIVQDGVVVQIDRTEKRRLQKHGPRE